MTVIVASTLDTLIADRERQREHTDGGACEYRLGQGQPLSKKRCPMCSSLCLLMELDASWVQAIDSGQLTGRSVEIVETVGIRSIKDAQLTWNLYLQCDDAQRNSQQCLLRRYFASFTCDGKHYTLRESTSSTPTAPLIDVLAQLLELFSTPGALPENFVHGNPSLTSISFLGRIPVPLRHEVPCKYTSRYLVQVDYGGADSAALTAALTASKPQDEGIRVSDGKLTIKSDITFSTFLREYLLYSKIIALHMLSRAVLSLYPSDEVSDFLDVFPEGGCSAKNLREVFDQIRGKTIPVDLLSVLTPRLTKELSYSPV